MTIVAWKSRDVRAAPLYSRSEMILMLPALRCSVPLQTLLEHLLRDKRIPLQPMLTALNRTMEEGGLDSSDGPTAA